MAESAAEPAELLIISTLRAGLLLCSSEAAQHEVAYQTALAVIASPDAKTLIKEEQWVLPNANLQAASAALKLGNAASAVCGVYCVVWRG